MTLLREAIGQVIKQERSKRTLRATAERAQVSYTYLSELEHGKKEVSSELLESICFALGLSVADFMVEVSNLLLVEQQTLDSELQKVLSEDRAGIVNG